MSNFAGFEIGKRSLQVQSQAINTAGHNISNADTEGYSRQRVQQTSMDALDRPDLSRAERPGQLGQGVTVEQITRLKDNLLESRIVAQSNKEAYWDTRENYLTMLEQIYNEPDDVSVRTNMDKFWQAWQELSLSPESIPVRRAVVTRGETLTAAVRDRYNRLDDIARMADSEIIANVDKINSLSHKVAELNKEIVRSRAMGDNPNDMLDKRDLLIGKLSQLVNVTTSERDSDEFMVHVDGKVLIQGGTYRTFETRPQVENSGLSQVIWSDTQEVGVFEGGTLAALLDIRDGDIRSEKQDLNTLTMNFMDLVNDVHRNGIGANNATGLDFFVEQPFVANALGNYDANGDGEFDTSYIFRMSGTNALDASQQVGLEGTITISGKTQNVEVPYAPTDTVRDIVERINNSDAEVKAYLDSNNRLVLKATPAMEMENPDFVIRHVEDSSHFLVGYAGILTAPGAEGAFDYATADAVNAVAGEYSVAPVLNPAGYIAVNEQVSADVLSVAAGFPNSNGVRNAGDGTVAFAIASIRNNPVMIGKSHTFDEYFADSVTNIGLKAEQAEISLMSQNTIMADLRNMRDSISGVNIDEELADILKFQHGYNAAARYITVVDELLDTIINRLGV